jgi:hypothetical protein
MPNPQITVIVAGLALIALALVAAAIAAWRGRR